MIYYDIHTHQPSVHPEDIAIVNTIIREECDLSMPAQWCSAGIHPWYIYNVDKQISCLESVASSSAIVAIGEAGLDKLVKTPLDIQKNVFLRQAVLAEKLKKPLIIHCVKAWGELIAVRKIVKPHIPWIIHGFRGNGELAQQLILQGFYLSLGEHFQISSLCKVWPERLLIETDESSCSIQDIYQRLASGLQISVNELGNQVNQTVGRLFPTI
ncbi:MAG: TatD family hydrolase [Parabacteroides gordonii]|uniref:TatD family hydrolase n=1 Tax=Parabacteroides gordonii TaxID=574930 RepID=UPI003A84CF7E